MIESMAFFAGMCLFLYVSVTSWRNKDSLWCIFFILVTLLFSFLAVDSALYGGEYFNMFAEWMALQAQTYDQAQ